MSKRWLIVLLIIVVAIVFRFYHIDLTPPGLYPDEAMNGNNALEALTTGDFKVFYPENNGREGLFINIQAISINIFGNYPWALRIVSAFFGTLTIIGTYLLVSRLFNWQTAAFTSFLLATSFWHTLFSRIGFRAIMAPFLMVWALYFLWRGLSENKLYKFAISGIFWGLGFYTYIAFRTMPLVVILVLLALWHTIRKKFNHEKYLQTRNRLIKGMALLMVTSILASLPLGYYFLLNPQDFFGRTGQLSIFASDNTLKDLVFNILKTAGMFTFIGDNNWRHNFSGEPLLFWPVGVLFVLGFIRSWYKLVKTYKKQSYFPTTQVMLLSWFFIGLLPVVISSEGLPHALRAILVVPVVFIFAGEALWWLYDSARKIYQNRDFHEVNIHRLKFNEGSFVINLAIILFLTAVMFSEFDKYFNRWSNNPNVPPAYATNYVSLGNYINELPHSIRKYVVVNAGGVLVRDIPMPAQTVMFITDSWTQEKQKAKNLFYITEGDYRQKNYEEPSLILFLENNEFNF